MGDEGRYLYAVCRGLDPSALAGVPAVGREPLEVIEVLDLQGVASTVDLDEFSDAGIRSTLEQTARRHETVVQACGLHAPTAPIRVATIYLDDWSVRRRLELWYDALVAALNRIAGRQQWSVRVYASASLRQAVPAGGHRSTAEARARAAAQEVDRVLGDLAAATRYLRAQDARLSGVEETVLLSGAYLVDDRNAAEFTSRIAGLVTGHPEVSIACGGPRPPYSFATMEEL